jgi:hypothetical protein
MQGRDQRSLTKDDYTYLQQAGADVYRVGMGMLMGQGNVAATHTESRKRPAKAAAIQPGQPVNVGQKRRKTDHENGAGMQQQAQVATQYNVPSADHLQSAYAQFGMLEKEFVSWESELIGRQAEQHEADRILHQRHGELANWQMQLEQQQLAQQKRDQELAMRHSALANWEADLTNCTQIQQKAEQVLTQRHEELSMWQEQLRAHGVYQESAQAQIESAQQMNAAWESRLIANQNAQHARQQQLDWQQQQLMNWQAELQQQQAQIGFYHQQNVQQFPQQLPFQPEVVMPVQQRDVRDESATSTSPDQDTLTVDDIFNNATHFESGLLDNWMAELSESESSQIVSRPAPRQQEVKETQASVGDGELFWDLNGDFNGFSQDYNSGLGATLFSRNAMSPNGLQPQFETHSEISFDSFHDDEMRFQLS